MGSMVSCLNLHEIGACAGSQYHNRSNNKFADQKHSLLETPNLAIYFHGLYQLAYEYKYNINIVKSGSQVNTEQRSNRSSSSSQTGPSSNSGAISINSYNASGSQSEPLAHRDCSAIRQEKVGRTLPESAEQRNIGEDRTSLQGKDVVSDRNVGSHKEKYLSDGEDVCPTCLEEYTPDNPKIVAKCLHHYHLSCIYEWMERSYTCPICQKLMEFQD